MKNYRQKIYRHYADISGKKLAPINTEGFKSREPFFLDIINRHFPGNKNINILEIGAGHGSFGYYIHRAGYLNYIGIDGSESQVNEARRLGINILLADILQHIKQLEENSLDLIVALDVIEHFDKEELNSIADDLYKALKKDGLLITHQPNGESPFFGAIRYGDYTHEQAFTKSSISQIFLASGFRRVTSYEDRPIAHGFKSFLRLHIWNLIVRPFYKFLLSVESGGVDREIILSKNFLTVISK